MTTVDLVLAVDYRQGGSRAKGISMNHWLALPLSVACLIAGCSGGEYPIKWTHHVELGSLGEPRQIDGLLDKPVITVNGKETISMINEGGKEAVASTPREWLRLRSDGYGPKTTYDIKAEGWYKRTCLPRLWLKEAAPAKTSYLRDFSLMQDPLRQLPATLGLDYWGERGEEIERESKQGKTWHDLSLTLKASVEDECSVWVEDDEELTSIHLLAWADFDGDGVEDVLLDVANRSKQGTICFYRMVVLTRKEPAGRLVIIKEE